MDERAAARVDHIAADGRACAHAERRVRHVRDGELRLRLDVIGVDRRHELASRGDIRDVLDLRIRPRQLSTDVVDTNAHLEWAADPAEPDVTTHALATGF